MEIKPELLATQNIHIFNELYGIRNEQGIKLDFRDHAFLWQPYEDLTPIQAILKAAQIGFTTLAINKSLWVARNRAMDIIYCVDKETEILTENGFKFYSNLSTNEKILTLNQSGVAEWLKVEEVFAKEVETETYQFEARNFNAYTTANHRWLVQDIKGNYEFIESKDLVKKERFIPKTANLVDIEPFYSDDYVELLAWVFAEGYYCKQEGRNDWSIILSQSELKNSKYCEEIRGCLRRNNTDWKEYRNKHNEIINFRFAYDLGKKVKTEFPSKLPTAEFAKRLTTRQSKLFIETFVKADGWTDSSGTKAISQKSKEGVDIINMIAVLGGYAPSLIPPGKNGAYTLRLTQFPKIYTRELRPTVRTERLLVWCPRTDNGTFYARRKGRCYWTGNTLPTQEDVNQFAGGKVNRIIANNPIYQEWTKDKDSVESKRVGDNIIYYRGSWSQKAAIMVSSDLNIYDEIDSSKIEVIEQYSTRLQHSNYRWQWYFSHPSTEGFGVDKYWTKSDQKHWFVKCPSCNERQYLSWPESIDQERGVFVCKKCNKEITKETRRKGEWIKKYRDRDISGYWIPLLICPWVTADQIVGYFNDKSEEYFYNKVLGLPYVGGGNKLTWPLFAQNLTNKDLYPTRDDRVVIGVDTGLKLDYVIGGQKGLFFHGEAKDYDELDALMRRWPKAIAIVDGGGDLIGSRKFQERWRGRVYLGFFREDRKTQEMITWGEGDNFGTLQIERNRVIQLCVDEFRENRIPVQGSEGDWQDYWSDWNNLTRVKITDPLTGQHKGFKWVRSGRDHRALATALWRAGIMRFATEGSIEGIKPKVIASKGVDIDPDGTFRHNLEEYFVKKEQEHDWRL